MSLMNFAKMLKSQKYHMILMFSMDMARKSQKYQLSKKLRETTVPNDNYDYILSKTNRSSHMSLMNFLQLSSTTLLQLITNIKNLSLMNFLQLSSTTLLQLITNIKNLDNLFAKELQTIPLILNMYI